jgi:predicted DCC family thiol-disulfide oxidoreductase YuxK
MASAFFARTGCGLSQSVIPPRGFRFTTIQSDYGGRLAQAFAIDSAAPDTNALILQGRALFKSDAVIAVVSELPGWQWVRALGLVPRPMRNAIFDVIARNRYRIIGTSAACFLGDPSFKERVLS